MIPETFSIRDLEKYGENRIFTKSFSIRLDSDCSDCMIVTSLARFVGEEAPTIRFTLTNEENAEKPIYQSHFYDIGKPENEWTRQQWRVPPMWHPSIWAEIDVTIPEGTRLELADLHNAYTSHTVPWTGGLRHNAHLGFWGIAPNNTLRAVEMAAQCGFASCIVNIKETKDGHLVCHHDATINKYARDKEGNRIPEEKPIYVSDLTLAELREWDFGVYKNPLYEGTKIATMEEVFQILSKTGLHGMFSTHPAPSDEAWEQVRFLLRKYGLWKNFHVKSFKLPILEKAYSYFGDSIDGYTFDNGDPTEFAQSRVGRSNTRLVMEFSKKHCSEELVKLSLDYGYAASVFALNERVSINDYKKFISWGVTEFTEDHHVSMGLNW